MHSGKKAIKHVFRIESSIRGGDNADVASLQIDRLTCITLNASGRLIGSINEWNTRKPLLVREQEKEDRKDARTHFI
jgi:hypothetical protein